MKNLRTKIFTFEETYYSQCITCDLIFDFTNIRLSGVIFFCDVNIKNTSDYISRVRMR